jgi:hypothetical protein
MAQVIGREEMTCRGLLRLTIIDSVAQLRQSSYKLVEIDEKETYEEAVMHQMTLQ